MGNKLNNTAAVYANVEKLITNHKDKQIVSSFRGISFFLLVWMVFTVALVTPQNEDTSFLKRSYKNSIYVYAVGCRFLIKKTAA